MKHFFFSILDNYTHSVFYSFSFIKSGKDLIKYDENNELNLYNGFKFLIMLFVVFGHRFLYVIGNPIDNVKIIENVSLFISSMNLYTTLVHYLHYFKFTLYI